MSGRGNSTPDYTAQQQGLNAARQRTIGSINNLFAGGTGTPVSSLGAMDPNPVYAPAPGREALYKSIEDAATAPAVDTLNYDQAAAQRQNKFALERSGLGQSSTALEEGDKTARMYNEGIRQIQSGAVAAANTARTADENARLGIIQQVNAGTDATSAINQASASMQNNLNVALAAARGNTIASGIFDPAALYYKQAATNAANLAAIPLYQKMMAQQTQLQPGGVTTPTYSGTGVG